MNTQEVDISALYRRYITMVRSRCRQLLGYRDSVDDVAQEVFVNFIKHRHRHGVEDNAAGLLYCMATRLCMDRLRSAYRRNAVFVEHETPREVPSRDSSNDGGPGSPDVENRLAVEKALSLLSDEERSVGASYYVHGLNQLEISETLDMPARTVSRRLERFRDRMRVLLDQRPAKRENSSG